jgi:hypothetical protein
MSLPSAAVDCLLSVCTGATNLGYMRPVVLDAQRAAAFSKSTEGAAALAPESGQLVHKGSLRDVRIFL